MVDISLAFLVWWISSATIWGGEKYTGLPTIRNVQILKSALPAGQSHLAHSIARSIPGE